MVPLPFLQSHQKSLIVDHLQPRRLRPLESTPGRYRWGIQGLRLFRCCGCQINKPALCNSLVLCWCNADWWMQLPVVLVPMVFYDDGASAFVTVNMAADPDADDKNAHVVAFQVQHCTAPDGLDVCMWCQTLLWGPQLNLVMLERKYMPCKARTCVLSSSCISALQVYCNTYCHQDRKDSQELQYLMQAWTEASSRLTPGSSPVTVGNCPFVRMP